MNHSVRSSNTVLIPDEPDEPSAPSSLSNRAQGRRISNRGGRAVFSVTDIQVGELVAVFGGRMIPLDEVLGLAPKERSRVLQISERWFLYSIWECKSDWINHSCEPNCGFRDEVTLVALRPISPGEEITFDYAMTDSAAYDEFVCRCGSQICRGEVKATDWELSDLRERYGGYFSPYLRGKMYGESLVQDQR